MRRAHAMRLLVLICCGTACADSATRLRNASAASLLQDKWQEDRRYFRLGSVKFYRPDPLGETEASFAPDRVPLVAYKRYAAFAVLGLIRLDGDRDLSQAFTGWGNFGALTQQGVQRVANVFVTPEGAKRGTVHENAGRQTAVSFVVGERSIKKIVSNEALEAGNGDRYRVVMGTMTEKFASAELYQALRSAMPEHEDGRFRALLKYDPFSSAWKLTTSDWGAREGDFDSQEVPTAIRVLDPRR